MNRDLYYSYIDEKLHILAHRITTNGKLNMLHLHLHSENFYLHFFNLLYGYNLENLNDVSQNVEAIDLIDYQKKVMIQVSSTSTKQKIESALDKDKLKEYVGYEFKFISIAKDATDLRGKTYKNPNAIKFDPLKDIYDIRFFLNTISSLDIEKLKKVYDFIHQELGDGNQNRFTPSILKDKYLNKFNEIKLLINSTSKPIEHIFINLAIIKDKKEEKENNKLVSRDAFLSSYEEIHKPKEPIKIKDLIDTSNKSLIYGKAGIGKTTLCKCIAYKWAKGELYQEFEYVIYISLREWKNRGLKGAIKDNYYSQDDEDITLDIKDKSQNILFLFDGYDELDSDRKKLLRDEIDKYSLTHYIITTRPYGYQQNDFSVDEHFETIGFTDKNVDSYIDKFFKKDDKKSQSLKSYLQSNISIKHIAYIPLMLEMICSLWEKEEFTDSLTMTELYSKVIEDMLNKYSASKDDERVFKRKNRKKIKEYLGKIAFEGLIKQKILFDGDLIEDAVKDIDFFEENVIYSGFLKSDVKEKDLLDNYFEFPHLTFQEYFSALYVSNLSEEEQSEIIRDWKFYPHMQMFFAFLGGLIEDKEFLLKEIESEPRDILGYYEFLLLSDCLTEMKSYTNQTFIDVMNKNLIEWLSYSIKLRDYEAKISARIIERLKRNTFFHNQITTDKLIKILEKRDDYYYDMVSYDISHIFPYIFKTEKLFLDVFMEMVESERIFIIFIEYILRAYYERVSDKSRRVLLERIKANSFDKQQHLISYFDQLEEKEKPLDDDFVAFISGDEEPMQCMEEDNKDIVKILKLFKNGFASEGYMKELYRLIRDKQCYATNELVDFVFSYILQVNEAHHNRTFDNAIILLNNINRNDQWFTDKLKIAIDNSILKKTRDVLIEKFFKINLNNDDFIDFLLYLLEKYDFFLTNELFRESNLRYCLTVDRFMQLYKLENLQKDNAKEKTFRKYLDIEFIFRLHDEEFLINKILLYNLIFENKSLYLKNNKFYTIKNGTEISTKREVDAEILNEINILLKGDSFED